MHAFVALLSPLALLLPAAVIDMAGADEATVARVAEPKEPAQGLDGPPAEPLRILMDARQAPLLGQVRIEQRVIIRISPSSAAAREQMMADLRRQGSSATSYQEEKLSGCIAIDRIAGV